MNLRRALFGALLCALGFVAPAAAGLPIVAGPKLFVSASSDWQLPAGQFQQSGLTFAAYYPPASASAWAYHLRAQTEDDRIIPLAIVGGCPPYHFTLNEGPPGATVSNPYFVSSAPPELTIPDVQVGEWDVDITVQDQCGSTPLSLTWTFEGIDRTDTSAFVYAVSGAAGGGTGSPSSPFNDLGDILGPNNANTANQGKQVILCGTFTMAGQSASYEVNNSRLRISTNKPYVWVGCEGGATLQGSVSNSDGAHFKTEGGADLAVVNIEFDNPLVDEQAGAGDPGLRNISASAGGSGVLFFRNTFNCTSIADGADGGANPAAIFIQGLTSGAVIGNTFTDCAYMHLLQVYDTDSLAIAHNTSTGSGQLGYHLKGEAEITNISLTFNVNLSATAPFAQIQSINNGPWTRSADFMHNRHVSTGLCLSLNSDEPTAYDVTSKRNSWKCDYHDLRAATNTEGSFVLEWDSLEHDGTQTTPNPGVDESGAGASIDVDDIDEGTGGILDDTTGLQEGGADCIHGAEICPP